MYPEQRGQGRRIQSHEKAPRLANLALFADLDRESLNEVSQLSSWWLYESGEEVRQSLGAANAARVVVEGQVDLLRVSIDGRVLKTGNLRVGEMFDFEVAPDSPEELVVARVGGKLGLICTVPQPLFLQRVLANRSAAVYALEQKQRRLHEAERLACELAFETVPTRVKHELRRLALDTGRQLVACTAEDLAWRAGTRAEEASRAIAQLERHGLVTRRGRDRIEIPDLGALL